MSQIAETVVKPESAYALVVDDHPMFVKGIANFLEQTCDITMTKTASSDQEVLDAIAQFGNPTLVILDFWLANGATLNLLKEIRKKCTETKILVVSADDDFRIVEKVKILGADGFLLKHETTETFTKVIKEIIKNEKKFPASAVAPINSVSHHLPLSLKELGLTHRQGEVLQLILKGFTNKKIAQLLGLCEQTVKEHVTIILQRLRVPNRISVITLLQGRAINL